MEQILHNLKPMVTIVALAMLFVLLAMIIDLFSGLWKAKQRGELRRSEALKRSLTKFIHYEGGLLIAAFVDILIYFSRVYTLFHLDILETIPVVTILIAIFLLVVEWLSLREKAEEKTKKDQEKVASAIVNIIKNPNDLEKLIDIAKNLRDIENSEEKPEE